MDSHIIINNTVQFIPNTDLYHLGVLQSTMHMAWLRSVGGRMKSDYQYSIKLVYNTFPWPEPNDKQRASIEQHAQAVLDARTHFPAATLADLYDPRTMPPELVKAHQALDKAVDAAYGVKGFATEAARVAFLFERYQQLAAPLIASGKRPSKTQASATKSQDMA